MIMVIGHQDHIIWDCCTIFFQVHQIKLQSISKLKKPVIFVIGEIKLYECHNVIEILRRVNICRVERGDYSSDIVCHI